MACPSHLLQGFIACQSHQLEGKLSWPVYHTSWKGRNQWSRKSYNHWSWPVHLNSWKGRYHNDPGRVTIIDHGLSITPAGREGITACPSHSWKERYHDDPRSYNHRSWPVHHISWKGVLACPSHQLERKVGLSITPTGREGWPVNTPAGREGLIIIQEVPQS